VTMYLGMLDEIVTEKKLMIFHEIHKIFVCWFLTLSLTLLLINVIGLMIK